MPRGLCRWLLPLALILTSCLSLPPPAERQQSAAQLAAAFGWQKFTLSVGKFSLAGFAPITQQTSDSLTIYIEGDGLAWLGSSDVSPDPTPIHPTSLLMALHQVHGNAVYLARPCQYAVTIDSQNCASTWWTDRRFAPEVIEASDNAIEQLKQRFHASHLILVGYSGGGAVATIVAARRQDVSMLVTVAGNLDHDMWTKMHHVSPLTGSLNPIDFWRHLVNVPQIHFAGSKDEVVPLAVTKSYLDAFPQAQRPTLQVIEGFDHACCWAEKWAEIYPGQ